MKKIAAILKLIVVVSLSFTPAVAQVRSPMQGTLMQMDAAVSICHERVSQMESKRGSSSYQRACTTLQLFRNRLTELPLCYFAATVDIVPVGDNVVANLNLAEVLTRGITHWVGVELEATPEMSDQDVKDFVERYVKEFVEQGYAPPCLDSKSLRAPKLPSLTSPS